MCKERVREFAGRGTIHDPRPQIDRRPGIRLVASEPRSDGHFSRWEGGPTAFGPVGRVTITVLVGAWLLNGFLHTFFILWLPLAFVGGMVLRDVWKRTWVPALTIEVPAAPTSDAVTADSPPGPRAPGREARPAPAKVEIPTRTKVAWVCIGVVGLVACLGFAYGSVEVKSAVLMAASLAALALWFGNLT
jgi:hypothetical protein